MQLLIKKKHLIYKDDQKVIWSLKIYKIKFIGEYTTAAGPFTDDYFFVFGEKKDKWLQASTLSIDHVLFWKELGEYLQSQIIPGLFYSTQWKSRILFPKKLEGQELFNVIKIKEEPKTFLQKLFGSSDISYRLELTHSIKNLFTP